MTAIVAAVLFGLALIFELAGISLADHHQSGAGHRRAAVRRAAPGRGRHPQVRPLPPLIRSTPLPSAGPRTARGRPRSFDTPCRAVWSPSQRQRYARPMGIALLALDAAVPSRVG